jgi:inner membrane transporter RhtA
MLKSIFILLGAMLSIQLGASLAKSLFPVIGSVGTTTLRIGFAAIVMCLISKPWQRSYSRDELRKIAVYGISLGVMNLFFYLALEKIPLGIAVALEFTGPLSVALWASRKRLDFVWAFLAAAGIYFVLPAPSETADVSLNLIGIIYALAAGACWALYIIFGQRLSHSLPAGIAASMGMLVAALVALPFGIDSTGVGLVQIGMWPVAFAVALLSSAIPYSLEMIALKRLPTKTFGILMSLEPALAAVSGFLFLKEELNVFQTGAVFCIIIASLGSALSSRAGSGH